jgi:CBS domain-containing protein
LSDEDDAAHIESIMAGPVETSRSTDLLEFVLRKMVEKNIGCLVIVDKDKPVGIITERDISRCVLRSPEAFKSTVDRVMSSPVIFLSPVAPIGEALETMLSYGIRRLPIVENGKLVGIVTSMQVTGESSGDSATLGNMSLSALDQA